MNALIQQNEKQIFHVHSYRCRHAEEVSDEEYIRLGIELGATDIWFTDHAPFPGDPFGARMKFSELDEYLVTLSDLREKYPEIRVHTGLETEYLPNFDRSGYYEYLRSLPELEILLLGQHMSEISSSPLRYSFSLDKDSLSRNEYRYLGSAIVQGISSGYFDAVAHPDRIFRRCDLWDEGMERISDRIIKAACEAGIPLEKNLSSAEDPIYYRSEFWKRVPENALKITGFDAHYLSELRSRYSDEKKLLKVFE